MRMFTRCTLRDHLGSTQEMFYQGRSGSSLLAIRKPGSLFHASCLTYEVHDGMLFISSTERQEALRRQVLPPLDHSYLVAGHCVLALIAAVIGGVLAPIVSDWRPVPTPSGRSLGTARTEPTRA
jgi:hypothetical protein